MAPDCCALENAGQINIKGVPVAAVASGRLLRPTSVCTDAAGKPVLQLPAQWTGFPLNMYRSAGRSECGPSHVDCPTLLLAVSGCKGRRWHRQNGKSVELSAGGEGFVDLYDRDYQREWSRWDVAQGYTVAVPLTPEIVTRLLPELPDFYLVTTHGLLDPKLQWLMRELLDEARSGAPGGMLYVESLSCALIARLAKYYARQKSTNHSAGGLSASNQRRISDFIQANLGEDLSITQLANAVGLCPDHFSRCFAVSFGLLPHRYVQQRRIEAALKMLAVSSQSIAEIAVGLGFYSHTHFTRVFHRQTGMTPKQVRLGKR